MNIKYVGLLLLPTQMWAADFRALDLGNICAPVVAMEQQRGSIPVPWGQTTDAVIYAFRGHDFGRDVLFNYYCPRGRLYAGNYYFPVEPFEVSIQSYHAVYDLLVAMYGKPFMDFPPEASGITASDPIYYQTGWHTSRVNIWLSLMTNFSNESPGRRVFLTIGPLHS